MYSPKLDEFLKFATQGNLIPVTRRILADLETPLSAYRKISGACESFLFESVEGGEHIGRYSFVGCNPRAVIRQDGQHIQVIENGRIIESAVVGKDVKDGLEIVERIMKKYRAVAVPGLPRFTGGALGFIGYEFIHDVEPSVPRPSHDELKTPDMFAALDGFKEKRFALPADFAIGGERRFQIGENAARDGNEISLRRKLQKFIQRRRIHTKEE